MQLQPLFLPLNDLLRGRLFTIPPYQRAYSWQRKHREALFNDIRKSAKSGNDHFMAGIVGLAGTKQQIGSEEFTTIDIVDGQQRLTTLILILRALASMLPATDDDRRDLERLLVKRDETSIVLLQTNHDKTHIFVDFLRSGQRPSSEFTLQADKNLLDAIDDCLDFVVGWPDTTATPLQHLYLTVRNRLTMIFHQISDERIVYTVFEVLNSRGLDVAWLDKFKSLLMGSAFELNATLDSRRSVINELHDRWGDIYGVIGTDQLLQKDTLRFLGTLEATASKNRFLQEEAASESLLKTYGTSLVNLTKCAARLLDTVSAEKKFLSLWEAAGAFRFAQARLTGVAIILRAFDENVELELITLLSRTVFGVYSIVEQDARRGNADYIKLAWDIHNSKLSAARIKGRLREMRKKVTEGRIRKALRNTNRYQNWGDQLRYLLFEYERHLCSEAGEKVKRNQWNRIFAEDPSDSIEHIEPQSRGSDKPETRAIYVHRLGNLTLVTPALNSSLHDKLPKDKQQAYLASGIRLNVEVAEMLSENKWNRLAVEQREQRIISWAVETWAS